jgi:tight adherence protein C
MGGVYDTLYGAFGDSSVIVLAAIVFVATAATAFGGMALVYSRGAVKRRAAGINRNSGEFPGESQNSLRRSSLKAVQRVLDYTSKHYDAEGKGDSKVLRRRMLLAGIYNPRAVPLFFVLRAILAIGFGFGAFIALPLMTQVSSSMLWGGVIAGGLLGYVGPSVYLDRRIAARREEHRAGFPDFMDLLVVCADSGLSMEASLERVGRELGDSYPSLCANLHMANLEIRAGRTLTEALEHLAERLGLEEARSFSTLIQQSAELGSSITDALRVYSDDMRHKRLSRAEEKAYSLPAKLTIPMMACIFPVLFVVILLPVIVRLVTGHY